MWTKNGNFSAGSDQASVSSLSWACAGAETRRQRDGQQPRNQRPRRKYFIEFPPDRTLAASGRSAVSLFAFVASDRSQTGTSVRHANASPWPATRSMDTEAREPAAEVDKEVLERPRLPRAPQRWLPRSMGAAETPIHFGWPNSEGIAALRGGRSTTTLPRETTTRRPARRRSASTGSPAPARRLWGHASRGANFRNVRSRPTSPARRKRHSWGEGRQGVSVHGAPAAQASGQICSSAVSRWT